MPADTQPRLADAERALSSHLAVKGVEIFNKYGPHIGWKELLQILTDRSLVRYPCEICFDASPLQAGEFAHPMAVGSRPEEGFTMFVHPAYQRQLEQLPMLVLYQLVRVNYGEFASGTDAETFGARAVGLSREEYYRTVCELADQITPNKKSE
jgi:hypothetical protein